MEKVTEAVKTINTNTNTNMNKREVCKYCGKERKQRMIGSGEHAIMIWVDDCTCVEDKEKAEEQRQKNVARIKALRKQYKSAGFTRKQLGKRLKNLTCEHKEEFVAWVKKFRPRKTKGMFLYGGVGNGKTTSGSCIAKELVNNGYQNVYFFTMAEYLNQMQNTYSDSTKIKFDDLMQKWFNADAVFIDDFGREKYSDKRLENVFLFFDGLYNNCTTFFIMANPENVLRVKSIPEFEAIFDRFSETLEKVVFKGDSLRKSK